MEKTEQEKRNQEAAEKWWSEYKGIRGIYAAHVEAFLAGIAHARAEAEALRERLSSTENVRIKWFQEAEALREENARLKAEVDKAIQTGLSMYNIGKKYEDQLAEAVEAIRKAVLWGECVSIKFTAEQRDEINFRYLNEAREALAKLRKDGT